MKLCVFPKYVLHAVAAQQHSNVIRCREYINGRSSKIVVVVVVVVVVVAVAVVVLVVDVGLVVLVVLVVVDSAMILELEQPSRKFPSKQAAMNTAVTRLQCCFFKVDAVRSVQAWTCGICRTEPDICGLVSSMSMNSFLK